MNADEQAVRVRIRYRPEAEGGAGETLWARPVEAHDGGYRLENHAFMTSLAAGDLVRAEPDGDGLLQVVDVLEPVDALLTVVEVDPAADTSAIESAMQRWSAAGAGWTEGAAGYLSTIWGSGQDLAAVSAVVGPDIEAGLVQPAETVGPADRTRDALSAEVDFSLQGPMGAAATDELNGDEERGR